MSRSLVVTALVASLFTSCSLWAPPEPKPDPRDRVPITRPVPRAENWEEEEEEEGPIDWALMRKRLEERFPGLKAVDFVRVLISSEKRAGICWTMVSPPWETELEIDYAIDGEKSSGSGYQELKSQGWWPIYRSPEGTGIELRAPFTEVDMTLGTEIACRCAGKGAEEGDSKHLQLRFRWKKGQMPEVSASVTEKEKRRGLQPGIVYGHLLTYEFEAEGSFPDGRRGRCGARVNLSILGDPPIL